MTKMNQPGTDEGARHETGEHEPKGEKASDGSGERHVKITNGVGMGKADDMAGRSGAGQRPDAGEHNTGRTEGTFYKHKKGAYRPGKY